jgi:hypothetical protein
MAGTFYLGTQQNLTEKVNNHPPEIIDTWISNFTGGQSFNHSYNIHVVDVDGDFMNIKLLVKHGNEWLQEQETFGRDGIYTLYPYVYQDITVTEYKVVISDNVNIVSKTF